MIDVYVGISIMLVIALVCLAFALRTSKTWILHSFVPLAILISAVSLGLYAFSGNKVDLNDWLTHGKEHYALMQELQDLGGIDGMIARVKQRLAQNPDDAKGWMILGKLYEFKNDREDANIAFTKARQAISSSK